MHRLGICCVVLLAAMAVLIAGCTAPRANVPALESVSAEIEAKKQRELVLDIAAAAAGVNTQGGFTRLGAQAGAGTYSVEYEREADYVGLYLLANAGFDETKAPILWRRMAIQNPNAIAHRGTHPTTPERFVALEKSVEEIAGKRISNQRLMPEMKSHAAPAAPDSEAGAGSR